MDIQYFGSVQTRLGEFESMLCLDLDEPDFGTLHMWNAAYPGAVALCKIQRDGIQWNITLIGRYSTDQYGGVIPAFDPEGTQALGITKAHLTLEGGKLTGEWSDDKGDTGRVDLTPEIFLEDVAAERCANWRQFKSWVDDLPSKQDFVFRGHSDNRYKLSSSLHRAGRSRLEKYRVNEVENIHYNLAAIIPDRLDLNNGEDLSVLLGLAQHHGFPTPLLDWTKSPYVAAYFAYADIMDGLRPKADDSSVRVYALSRSYWGRPNGRVSLSYVRPYIEILQIVPRGNQRIYAQQGLFTVTNVGNIGGWICGTSSSFGATGNLLAADIPKWCCNEAMADLEIMGLTAGTMYPGLDGACRMLKHQLLRQNKSF